MIPPRGMSTAGQLTQCTGSWGKLQSSHNHRLQWQQAPQIFVFSHLGHASHMVAMVLVFGNSRNIGGINLAVPCIVWQSLHKR